MHEWDRRLRTPPPGQPPVRWRDAEGNPTQGQLRGPRWRRTSYGHYVPDGLEASNSQRIVEASPLTGRQGAITGWAAGYWKGVPLLGGSWLPLPLALGAQGSLRSRADIDVSRERLPTQEVEQVRGVPCTVPLRAGFDSARTKVGLRQAVRELDMMLASGLFAEDELRVYVAEHAGWRRIAQARAALAMADHRTASPQETSVRLVWMLDAGLPRPLVNPPVFDLDGRLLGYPDVLDAEAGTAVEYDSADHRDLDNHTDDNDREELFEDHGLVVCRITRRNLTRPRHLLAQRMQRSRERGLARDRRKDRWTLEPPPGWRDHWFDEA
jgi:hypothetical protein